MNDSLKELIQSKDIEDQCGGLEQACCTRFTKESISKIAVDDVSLDIPAGGKEDDSWLPGWLESVLSPVFEWFKQGVGIAINDSLTIVPDTTPFYCVDGLRIIDRNTNTCTCRGSVIGALCQPIGDPTEKTYQCADCSSHGIWTGIGCVDFNIETFIQKTIFGWGLGLAGTAAVLCFIYASFQMQISGTNPEKLKEAQELLTSCITGLIVIIFSVVILRIIGVDILRLPFLQ